MPGFRQGMIYEDAFPGTGVDLKLPQTKWTYSQGVIASGLGLLYTATGNGTYLTEAEKTIDAVVAGITANGILKENCDDVTHSTCDEDQVGSGIPPSMGDYSQPGPNSHSSFSRYSRVSNRN